MTDVLSLFRDFVTSGRPVSLADDNLLFGSIAVPRSTETCYRSKRGATSYYTIETVWFCHQHKDDAYGAYVQAARAQQIPTVSAVDRADVLNYVTGEIASSQNIDPNGPRFTLAGEEGAVQAAPPADAAAPTTDAAPAQEKRRAEETGAAAKKARVSAPIPSAPAKTKEPKIVSAGQAFIDEVVRREKTVKSLSNCLFTESKSYPSVLRVVKDLTRAPAAAPPSSHTSSSSAAAAAASKLPSVASSRSPSSSKAAALKNARSATTPIIIVPPAATAVVNLHNIKELLEDGHYSPPTVKVGKKETSIMVTHRIGTADKAFQVVDAPESLRKEDWARVVCVFVHGPAWQFKGWPDKWSEPAYIFNKTLGLNIKFRDQQVEPNVKNWNVTVLDLERQNRHLDATVSGNIWTHIEKSLLMRPL